MYAPFNSRAKRIVDGVTYLASSQNPANFANDWLVATQVSRALEHEAQVIAKIVPGIVALQFDREADETMFLSCASDKPAIQGARRYHVFRDVVKVE